MGDKIRFEAKVCSPGLIHGGEYIPVPLCAEVGKRYRVTLERIEPELKPCPFCGGEADVTTTLEGAYYWVSCNSCNASGPRGDWENARLAWNRREG